MSVDLNKSFDDGSITVTLHADSTVDIPQFGSIELHHVQFQQINHDPQFYKIRFFLSNNPTITSVGDAQFGPSLNQVSRIYSFYVHDEDNSLIICAKKN